ncbi:MAG: orotidine-5'-phosphate decarboxylase, partial [Candidatus Marinimicrobia bacterium]|nr:orotidine-5'-phosphate decarboxylase [Candidatus Neomarinimicrobiota bacterium]
MVLSFNHRLQNICKEKSNSLCIGLDIDPDKFPSGRDTSLDGMEAFGKEVIDGTIDFCPAYKPNLAFFERFGSKGYALLERLVDHINGRAVVIADAKRGDIGNTSQQYAKAILETMGCDAITISPYMGREAIEPFIENAEKGSFILAVTSNPGARELQEHGGGADPLYKKVIQLAVELNT